MSEPLTQDRAEDLMWALLDCARLVRQAVYAQRAHKEARDLTPEQRINRPDTWRLPELDLRAWYADADEAVRVLDGEE